MTRPGKGWRRAVTTHCPHGHEYTPENTLLNGDGWRYCRTCNREAAKLNQRARRMGVFGHVSCCEADSVPVSGSRPFHGEAA